MNGLERRRIEGNFPGLIHLNIDAGIDDRDEYEDHEAPCCMAGAMRGPRACTCWQPVFDLEQAKELQVDAPVPVQEGCCFDCAYRNGSPERDDGYLPELVEIATDAGSVFYCHDGMRRAVAYRHPDGRVLPAEPGDYLPPQGAGRAYRADGSPAAVCAGWVAHRRAHGLPVAVAGGVSVQQPGEKEEQ